MAEFKLGDLVWAKMKGFPSWPGMIAEASKDKPHKKGSHWIYFFGSKNYSWIDYGNIKSYLDHKAELEKANKTASFKEACRAIEDVHQNGESSSFNPVASNDVAFDRLVSDSSPVKTPKTVEKPPKAKTSSKKRPSKAERTSKASPLSSDQSDSEVKLPRKKFKAYQTPKKPRSKYSDRHSSHSDIPLSDDASSGDEKRSAKKTSKGRSSSSRDNSRYSSRFYSDADTTTPAGTFTSPVDYSLTMHKRTATIPLLDRPPPISLPEAPRLNVKAVSKTLMAKNIVPSTLKFGFLGLGNMGSGVVKNLLNSGHSVIVWNRTPDKSNEFMKAGALTAPTPQDVVASADITFSCVCDPQAAKDLMFGNCGALVEMGPNKSFVEMTSIDPVTSKDLSEAVTSRGGRYLEVQLQGSRKEADEGTLIILSAGDKSLYNDCHSCFEAMGRCSFFFGEVGSASKMNLVIQLICGVALSGLAEAMALADKIGLQLSDVVEVLGLTQLSCPYLLEKGNSVIRCSFETDQALTHMQKDLSLVLSTSESVDQPLPMAATANEIYKHAKRLGYSEHDVAAVFVKARF